MKTAKCLLATLIVATFIFVGCQKDNTLISESQQAALAQDAQLNEGEISSDVESYSLGERGHSRTKTIYGRKVKFANGSARAFVKVNHRGYTEEVGAILSAGVLRDLPDHEDITTVLEIPQVGSKTYLKHVYLGYNPHGHPPVNIYTLPHFDIHFYNTTSAERESITTPTDPRINIFPHASYLPTNYIATAAVPLMGMHWEDVTGPEFNGQRFTSTFVYGTLNGKVTFYEPMITVEYIKNTASKYFPIKQPIKYGRTGYYAHEYGLRYNNWDKQYEIVLRDFKKQRGE